MKERRVGPLGVQVILDADIVVLTDLQRIAAKAGETNMVEIAERQIELIKRLQRDLIADMK